MNKQEAQKIVDAMDYTQRLVALPVLVAFARAMVAADPDLLGSTCGCCESKRQAIAQLRAEWPAILEGLK